MSTVTPLSARAPNFWVLVPTYNPGLEAWAQWVQALQTQNDKPAQVVVVDSGSTDGSLALSQQAGFTVFHTLANDFNHGGTRQWALDQALKLSAPPPQFLVCLTQDALLASADSVQALLRTFDNPEVAAAFGRQLPKKEATWLETHSRTFNYPAISRTVQFEDKANLGIKTCFLSNSFAAYRLQDLQKIGGFPNHLPLGEDTYVAAQFLIAGRHIGYQATARVYHSHNYNGRQDFQRMFDTGVFHAQNQWLLGRFGAAEGEGLRLLMSQWRYLMQSQSIETSSLKGSKPHWALGLLQLLTINCTKYAGYKMGRAYKYLPYFLVQKFAMHKVFWQKNS